MFDIHTHLIPNVDDGAQSMEETIQLARAAIEEGIEHLVLTPHHNQYWVKNEKDKVLRLTEEIRQVLKEENIPLSVAPGQEIRMNEEFMDDLTAGNYLSLDGAGKYYLVEFSWRSMPVFAKSYLQQMLDLEIIPVIAHPERQRPFLDHPELLVELIDMGCIAQVTATSVIGGYTQEIKEAAFQMIEQKLVHVIASDTHNLHERPYNLVKAAKVLENNFGLEHKDVLFNNAKNIVEGKPIEVIE